MNQCVPCRHIDCPLKAIQKRDCIMYKCTVCNDYATPLTNCVVYRGLYYQVAARHARKYLMFQQQFSKQLNE